MKSKKIPQKKNKSAYILAGGLIASLFLVLLAQLVDRPQCPDFYSQAQVDAGGCIVGANIGMGMLLLAAAGLAIGTVLVAVHYFLAEREEAKKR